MVRAFLAGLILLASCAAAQAQTIVSQSISQVYGSGTIYAVQGMPDGRVVIAGLFSHVNGVARNNIARFNADGTLDATWNPNANSMVRALAIDSSGNVFAGGMFTSIGGATRNFIAKLNSTNGQADAMWNPGANAAVHALALDFSGALWAGGAFTNIGSTARNFLAKLSDSGTGVVDGTWNPNANAAVEAIRLDGVPGNIYVGGNFTNIGGASRTRLARLPAYGTATADAWNVAAGAIVRAIRVDGANNVVYVGGDFLSLNGSGRNYLAKVSTSPPGTVDTAFSPQPNASVHGLDFDGAGNLFAGGEFGFIGGMASGRIAKVFTSNGALDSGWVPGIASLANNFVRTVQIQAPKVLAGGTFQQIGGTPRGGFAVLDLSTAAAIASYPPVIYDGATVSAMARDASGRTVIGGIFMMMGDKTTPRFNLARINADGSLDTTWNPAPEEWVFAIEHDASGNVLVGGQFKTIGGLTRPNIAKVSGTGAGVADAAWNPSGADGPVWALVRDGAGNLYAGGPFTSMGGQPRNRIARLSESGAGAVDATWNPNADNWVRGLALDGAGNIFVGGDFANIGGAARSFIAKISLSGTGAADPGFNPGANAVVKNFAVAGSSVIATGLFTNIGGQPRNYVARLAQSNGAVDASWNPNASSYTTQLALDGAGNVFVAGEFTTIGGQPRSRLARIPLAGTGTPDSWNPTMGGGVFPIKYDSGKLYAGGGFRTVGGTPWPGFVVVTASSAPGAPVIGTATAGNAQASVTFSPPATDGGSPITSYTVTSSPGNITASGTASPIIVTGLTNGTAYTFTVTATNAIGTGPASAASNSVTPAAPTTVPGPPVIGTATAGNAQATVTFSPPASNGGSPITGYTVTSSPGGITASGAASPIIVAGLTNGTAYTFTVTATNAIGTGPASAASNSVTPAAPATAPGAPVIGTATASNAQATVTFTAPASNGGSPITGYTVTSTPGSITASGTGSPITVTGLTNGTTYTFSVTATNAVGTGPASAPSNAVTPSTVPGAPVIGVATAGNTQATVSFSPPASNGGAPITAYTATSSPGGITATSTASPITVPGLANGTAYTFTVTATNARGTGPASAPSNSVTPAPSGTPPGAPTLNGLGAGNGQAIVTFSAPASTGGAPITSYTASCMPGPVSASGSGSPITVSGLANGTTYSCSVTATNSFGTGAPSASLSVVPFAPISPMVATAQSHALALTTEGKVYAWGNDSFGQLGQGRIINRTSPTRVTGLPAIGAISMQNHVLALDVNRQVWSWGDNSCGGQLGPREGSVTTRPARVIGAVRMSAVAAGLCYSLALRIDGTLWGWGFVPGYSSATGFTGLRQLTGVSSVTQIAAGYSNDGVGHGLALRSDGTVYAFGQNTSGQLGVGSTGAGQSATVISGLANVSAIAAGNAASLALLQDGSLRFWGTRQDGTLNSSPAALPAAPAAPVSITLAGKVPYVAIADGRVFYFHAATGAWVQEPGWSGITRVAASALDTLLGIDGSGQLFAGSDTNFSGQLGQGHTNAIANAVTVPGFSSTTMAVAASASDSVLALKSDGSVWFWGADTLGQSGDGGAISRSVPFPVPIPAIVKKVAVGDRFSAALDISGNVWGWGENNFGPFGSSLVNRSSPGLIANISGVADIAAGSRGLMLFLKADGTVWKTGTLPQVAGVLDPTQVSGLSNIVRIKAGTSAYALRNDGALFAWGFNQDGELGNGTTTSSPTPVQVTGIAGSIVAIGAGEKRAAAVTADGKVWTWGKGVLGNGTSGGSATPVQVTGISDAADVSIGLASTLVRRQNGGLQAWGVSGLSDSTSQNVLLPHAVQFHEPVRDIALGASHNVGFIIGSSGLLWGYGYQNASTTKAVIGDGGYVARPRPVVVLAAGGAGSVDTNDWYFDLDPSTAESIPAASLPRSLSVGNLSGSESGLSLEAIMKYKSSDIGKRVNNYVFAQVPAEFFGLVKNAPGTPPIPEIKRKAREKNGAVLAQLTPAGWTTVGGQIIAYSQATANAAGSAANILNGVNASAIPGAKFCIGYGENSGSMLSNQSLTEVLSLEGASSSAQGVPCVFTGLYVDGPTSSTSGSAVTFRGSVVGFSPTGTVQFQDGSAALLGPNSVTLSNEAVGSVSISTSSLAVGTHSIGGVYSGDSQNAAASATAPVSHTVVAAPPGQTVTALTGPASSDSGSTATFSATVTGSSPSGTVQFKDGAANLGEAVPLVGGMATLRTSALATGSHSVTAAYSGDTANAASTSSALSHTVYAAIETAIALAASPSSANVGTAVTLTATVTATNPTGSVTFLDGGTVIGTATLANGSASITVSSLESGTHAITAQYAGEQTVSSSATFVTISVPGSLNMSPGSHDFGGQSMRTTQRQAFVVFNSTSAAITISSVGVAGSGFTASHDCGSTLAVGAICTVTVSYTPTDTSAGSGTLTVATSAGNQTAAVSGVGERSLTSHYYRSILRRAPDSAGKQFWEAEAARVSGLGANVNETWFAMAMSFYNSSEYLAFGRGSADYVRDLYNTFFNRNADDAGLNYWVGQMSGGMPREVVLASFMFSTEFTQFAQAIFGNTAARAEVDTVVDFYRGLLGRLPDTSGFNFWVGQFRQAQCQGGSAIYEKVEAISSAYANSPEYAGRNRTNAQYIGDLYNAFLRRGGDLDGVRFWIGQLDSGARTRDQVRRDFMASPEFNARVVAIVNQGCLP